MMFEVFLKFVKYRVGLSPARLAKMIRQKFPEASITIGDSMKYSGKAPIFFGPALGCFSGTQVSGKGGEVWGKALIVVVEDQKITRAVIHPHCHGRSRWDWRRALKKKGVKL